MKGHLETLHKTQDFIVLERTECAPEKQTNVEKEKCKMTNKDEEVVYIRSDLELVQSSR